MARKRSGSPGQEPSLEDSTEPGYTRRQRFDLATLRIKERARLLALLIRTGVLGVIVYCVDDAVKALAGRTTIAQLFVKVLANQGFSNTVAWLFGSGGIGLGMRERHLRHRESKRLADRIKQYETPIDPGRKSSKLDSLGDYEEDD